MQHISALTLKDLDNVRKQVGMELGPSHILTNLLMFVRDEGANMLKPIQGTNLTAEELEALRDGKKIMAIRMIRARTGLGLLESKEMADTAEYNLRRAK